tara:strand:+ start:638 stop:1390 length:753 start_codon:yes stop_codon:yes gene_type:complete
VTKSNLFQILITEDDIKQEHTSLTKVSDDLSKSFLECEYSLWNNSMILEFLEKEHDQDVFKAYKSLVPFAYKSDLARYCLLYSYGGWYFDLGTQLAGDKRVIAPLAKDIDMIFFWDVGDLLSPARSFYDCMNGIIFSKPKNPILKLAIDLVVENCKTKFYGSDSMSPTGPGVLGRSIAIYGKNDNLYDGQFIQLTPQHNQSNKAYVLRDGTIFAWHRSHFRNEQNILDTYGLKGGNDYRTLWRDRLIYSS